MRKTSFILLLIIILASFLRIWKLESIPPSPDWDEVTYGYNAYSILQTGRDEYGAKLPVILRSYDDYKPALYSYLTIPSVATLGLNTLATRLPNAILGVIGVVGCFFLVRKLLKRDDLALVSSFFLAVSPWSIQFSRFSHEAIVGVGLNILTVLFFLIGVKKYKYLLLSALFWGLSFYSYQSEKLFAPLLGLLLFIIFFKEILKVPKRYIVASVIAALIIVGPMLLYVKQDPKVLSRAAGTSIFAHQTEILGQSAKQLIEDKKTNNYLGLIINNRRVVYAQTFVKNYISHFDPSWLFFKGDLPRHHPPGMGILYLLELPFILLGIFSLIRYKDISTNYKFLIFGWFLIAPIPAALTFDVPHAARDMNVLPLFQIFTALGLVAFFTFIKERQGNSLLRFSVLVVSLLFLVNFGYYLNQYFVNLNKVYSQEWQYGYKEAISEVDKLKGGYKQIVVSDQVPMDQSYMFFLFFLKYPPEKYQKEGPKMFDSFVFRKIDWTRDSTLENTLIVGSAKDIPAEANKLFTVNFLSGEPAIIVSTAKK